MWAKVAFSLAKTLDLRERRIMATQLIEGVDYCPYADLCERLGTAVPAGHILNCNPCLVEERRITAWSMRWKRVSHERAQLMFLEQKGMFRDGKKHYGERDYQMFWGHLTVCLVCASNFKRIVADLRDCNHNIIGRHWPLEAELSTQNGRYHATLS